MNTIHIMLLSCIAAFCVIGCTEKNENRIYFLVGTGSPDFDLAIEGSTSQFMVTGPGKDNPYGKITITADGIEKGNFSWGGSVCEIGTALNPPKLIGVEGESSVELFYGIVDMHPDSGKGILKRKGKLGPGIFKVTFAELTPTTTTGSNQAEVATP